MLECAIPEHLRRERKCPVSTPADYVPPFPAYCARFPTIMKGLVMAKIGVQYSDHSKNDGKAIATIKEFVTSVPQAVRPSFWEIASVTDKKGAYNLAVLAYWPDENSYHKWASQSGFKSWWQSPGRETEKHGWFLEVLSPSIDRFQTVFSSNENPEGAANMKERMSDEMEEHAYWGSMRDRLPVAQDDNLKGERGRKSSGVKNGIGRNGAPSVRIRVPGKNNLCVIRSGQDWSDTLPAERKLYLETIHPVLVKGMNYLRDEGRDDGCYAMNLWDVVDPTTYQADRERTYGFGYFDDLASRAME